MCSIVSKLGFPSTGAQFHSDSSLAGQVTQMTYCKATKIIISADYHGNVVVTSEIQCKLKEVSTALLFSPPNHNKTASCMQSAANAFHQTLWHFCLSDETRFSAEMYGAISFPVILRKRNNTPANGCGELGPIHGLFRRTDDYRLPSLYLLKLPQRIDEFRGGLMITAI